MIILNNQPVNIQEIEKHVNLRGTCDAGMIASLNTIVCADLAGFGDDFFDTLYFLQVIKNANAPGNSPENNARDIINYVSATGTFTASDFPDNVEEGDEILILHQYQAVPTEWVSLTDPRISRYSAFASFQTIDGNPVDFVRATMSLEALREVSDLIRADTADIRVDTTSIKDTDLPAVKVDTADIRVDTTSIKDTDLPAVANDLVKIIGESYELSDDVLHSNDAEAQNTTNVFVKIKEFITPFTGTLRIKFDHRCNPDNIAICRATVYKNGIAHGAESTNSDGVWTEKKEDLAFVAGDKIQIYAKVDAPSGARYSAVRYFRILGLMWRKFENILE